MDFWPPTAATELAPFQENQNRKSTSSPPKLSWSEVVANDRPGTPPMAGGVPHSCCGRHG